MLPVVQRHLPSFSGQEMKTLGIQTEVTHLLEKVLKDVRWLMPAETG